LRSISEIEYPGNRFRTAVVADNCTDGTANVASSMGFEYLERTDSERKGKGYALDWALKRLRTDNVDAIVVIDADSNVSRNILTVFNSYLACGFKAVQAANLVDKNQDGLFPVVFALGNLIANYYVYYPKFKMGSSAFLLGTGMCFHRSLLHMYLHDSYSISEDIEFSFRLITSGVRIAFTTRAYVETVYPENIRASSTQRIRWSSGTLTLLRKYLPFLFFRGIMDWHPVFIDTAFTLLSWSKPIIGIAFGLTLFLTLWISSSLHILAWVLFAAELSYLCLGILLLRRMGHSCRPLWKAPFLIPWFVVITGLGLCGFRKQLWNRTDRE